MKGIFKNMGKEIINSTKELLLSNQSIPVRSKGEVFSIDIINSLVGIRWTIEKNNRISNIKTYIPIDIYEKLIESKTLDYSSECA